MTKLNLPKQRFYDAPCSLFKRTLAFLLDIMILDLVVFSPFESLFANMIPKTASYSELIGTLSANSAVIQKMFVITVISSILMVLYFTILEWKLGQTLGKMILEIRLISKSHRLFLQTVVF